MPRINGRFYANPAYGEALERARAQEAARRARGGEQQPGTRAPTDPLANQIYNETSGLRPATSHGPGSAEDLHEARVYMAHVIRNREATGERKGVAPNRLRADEAEAVRSYPPARRAYQDSLDAGARAMTEPDPTGGATSFYLDFGQSPPRWATRMQRVAGFGPFRNPAGSGDVPRAAKVKIVILH